MLFSTIEIKIKRATFVVRLILKNNLLKKCRHEASRPFSHAAP